MVSAGDGGFSQQKSIPKDLRETVKRAISMGWTAKKTSSGGHTMHSPRGTARFYVPITAKDPSTLARTFDVLISKTYIAENPGLNESDPETMAFVVEGIAKKGGSVNVGMAPTIVCALCKPRVEFIDYEGFAAHQTAAHPPQHQVTASEGVQEQSEESGAAPDEGQESTASAMMHDMEEAMEETFEPWRAIKERPGDGTVLTYASSAVLTVNVGGKFVTHKCPLCEYRNDNPRSVVGHYGQHIARGEAKQMVDFDFRVEPEENYPKIVTKGRWVQSRDEAEAAMYAAVHARLRKRTDSDSVYARALTERLAEAGWMLCRGDEASPEAETLDAIRAMLGMGKADEEALTRIQAELSEMKVALEKKDEALALSEEERNRLKGFVDTLAGFARDEASK